MASSPLSRALEKTLECPICGEIYDDPKALPCMHTYCGKCIDQWIRSNAGSGQPTCPDCRQPFGPETVRGAFQLRSLIELQRQYVQQNTNQTSTEDQDTSGTCSGCMITGKSFVFCCDCDQLLCATCSLSHRTHDLKSEASVLQTTKEEVAAYIKELEVKRISHKKCVEASVKKFSANQDRIASIRHKIRERAKALIADIRKYESEVLQETEDFIGPQRREHRVWGKNADLKRRRLEQQSQHWKEMLDRNSEKEITNRRPHLKLVRSTLQTSTPPIWRSSGVAFEQGSSCFDVGKAFGKLVTSKAEVSYATVITGLESPNPTEDVVMVGDPCARSKGIIRFIVANISALKTTILSEPVCVRDFLWSIKLMPNKEDNKQTNDVKALSFYLECNPKNQRATGSWTCQLSAKLTLVSQKKGIEDFTMELNENYSANSNGWGYLSFKAWSDVIDPSKGYINKEDTIIVEAHISDVAQVNVPLQAVEQTVVRAGSRKRGLQRAFTSSLRSRMENFN